MAFSVLSCFVDFPAFYPFLIPPVYRAATGAVFFATVSLKVHLLSYTIQQSMIVFKGVFQIVNTYSLFVSAIACVFQYNAIIMRKDKKMWGKTNEYLIC